MARTGSHQSPRGCPVTTLILLRIMNRPAGFSSIATENAAPASASEQSKDREPAIVGGMASPLIRQEHAGSAAAAAAIWRKRFSAVDT
jgi:hypothetical protein